MTLDELLTRFNDALAQFNTEHRATNDLFFASWDWTTTDPSEVMKQAFAVARLALSYGEISPAANALLWVGDKAHLYLLAQTYGLEAAMLYKLSDGAIDPRQS